MSRRRASPHVSYEGDGLTVVSDPARPSGRFLWQDGMESSYVDLADEQHLEFDYLRWIRAALTRLHARRVLHLGGGACSLARALADADPDGHQEVVEVDAGVLAVARDHLGLRRRPGLRVRHAEARAALAAQRDGAWDAVVLDAFLGAVVPAHLTTEDAARDCARVAPVSLVNVVDNRGGQEVTRVAGSFRVAYGDVWRIDGRGGNTVLLAGAPDVLERISGGVAADLAADPAPGRLVPFPAGRFA